MEKNQLKENLLQLNIFENNNYLDTYCDLIIKNQATPIQKEKTNKHHVIPVCYYKKFILQNDLSSYQRNKQALLLANQDQNNFTVNLFYKDHILAHYYLCLCSKRELIGKLSLAFFCLTFRTWKYQEFNPTVDLSEYQYLYECFIKNNHIQNKGKKRTQDQKLRMSIAAKARDFTNLKYRGQVWVYKDDIQIRVNESTLKEYIEKGFSQGKLSFNKELCEYISNQKKNICTKKVGVKEVYLIELSILFPNSSQASKWLNNYFKDSKDYAAGIRNCCKLYNLRAGGFHWCYKEDVYKYKEPTKENLELLESQVKQCISSGVPELKRSYAQKTI